jgi:hypothetical protein
MATRITGRLLSGPWWALCADLQRVMKGANPSRSHTRELAAELRRIQADAVKILGEVDVDEFDEHVNAARAEVLAVFGTSGWDGSGKERLR